MFLRELASFITWKNINNLLNFGFFRLVDLYCQKKLETSITLNENLLYKKGLFYFCLPKLFKKDYKNYIAFLNYRALYVNRICRPAAENARQNCQVWQFKTSLIREFFFIKFSYLIDVLFRLYSLKKHLFFLRFKLYYRALQVYRIRKNNDQLIRRNGKMYAKMESFVTNNQKKYRVLLWKRRVILKGFLKKLENCKQERFNAQLLRNSVKMEFDSLLYSTNLC